MAGARWQPDASANCPADQPISNCQVTPAQQLYTVTLDCVQSAASAVGLANPASVNCVQQGGTLAIETRGDGGQCPVGSVKVTGYVTPAARYCAITGGEYTITGKSGESDEQGTCTLKNGTQCDAWDYFNGKCEPS